MSLLGVRGPAPTASATNPMATPTRAIRFPIIAARRAVAVRRTSAVAAYANAAPQIASTMAAGLMRGSWNGPTAIPACCTAPNQNSAAFAAVIHASAVVTPDTLRDLAAHDAVRRGRREPFDGGGQRESGRDQPHEARKACQWDQDQ